jgi:hypothetical protein
MKISYANMKLKTNTEVNTFDFLGQKVEVLKYLPAQDKYDLLMVTLQEAMESGGAYNEFKLNVFFELNLVYMYTNISFTEKQKEDEFKIYDNLKSNGFFELFFQALDENEYNELFAQLNAIKVATSANRMSVGATINKLINDLPKNAEAAAKIVENFDPQKYKEVVDFARYANGGRDINTNLPIE